MIDIGFKICKRRKSNHTCTVNNHFLCLYVFQCNTFYYYNVILRDGIIPTGLAWVRDNLNMRNQEEVRRIPDNARSLHVQLPSKINEGAERKYQEYRHTQTK